MRNFKKILIAVSVIALLVTGCAIWALADGEENVGSVEELVALVETAENASVTEEKYAAVVAIAEYLDTYELNTADYTYSTAMARTNKLAVNCALDYLEAVYAEGVDDNTALDCIVKASDLLHMFELPESTSGLARAKEMYNEALVKTAYIFIDTIDADIETTRKTAKNQIAINKMSKLMRECSFYGDENPLAEVEERFEELRAAHERAVAANLKDLDNTNDASNYDLPIYYEQDWEKRPVGFSGTLADKWSVVSQGTSNKIGIDQEKNGNKFYVQRYVEKDKPAGSFAQMGLSGFDATYGLVFEFDVTTFGDIPDQGVVIETGSIGPQMFPPSYLCINNKGDLCDDKYGTNIFLEGALVKGEWLHIILAFDPEDFTYNLYVAGEFLAKYDAKYNGKETFDHSKVAFRLSGGNCTSGEICFDNILIYSGNTYRDHDRLNNMNDEEKFCYFVDFFQDENTAVLDRKDGYDRASQLLDKYWIVDEATGVGSYAEGVLENETLKAAVDAYLAFDINTVIKTAKAENLAIYMEKVDKLSKIARSYSTVEERRKLVTEINEFTAKYANLIDKEMDQYPVSQEINEETGEIIEIRGNGFADYNDYYEILSAAIKNINYDANSDLFIKSIDRFLNATTLSAMQRHYDRAKELIDSDSIDLNIILDPNAAYRENFKDLIEAYNTYKNSYKKVDAFTRENNAYKIVLCMKKISGYRTEEEWAANEEEIMQYLNIIKRIVLDRDADGGLLYNEEYEGVKQAVANFNDVYGYFYIIKQEEHVVYISDLITHISETDSYIKKVGMISMLDRYFDTNEIDYTDARIVTLVSKIETYRSELELRREDYAKTLIENATYFTSFVEKMRTAKTYNEQKAYFEQAAVYYFSLDISVDGTERAVEIFDEYKIKLENIEAASKNFVEAVALYKACETEDEKYAALVECYRNASLVELSYEGASEAMAEYQSFYGSYVSYATAVNNDLVNTGNVVGSLRIKCGITTVIAVILKKIFGV